MDNQLTLLLIEDEESICRELSAYVNSLDDTVLVGVTNSSSEGINLIREKTPDALLLDLELSFGSGNGLNVLQALNEDPTLCRPYVLVTTNNPSTTTHAIARNLGADFILLKHQDDYTSQKAVDFLRMIKSAIKQRKPEARQPAAAAKADVSPEENEKQLTRRICTELDNVGISQKAVGYNYLTDAIAIYVKDPTTQNICTILGKKYGKTGSSVERAMQNAIERAWNSTDIEDLLKYYTAKIRSEKGVPTLTEFISYYATRIRNN